VIPLAMECIHRTRRFVERYTVYVMGAVPELASKSIRLLGAGPLPSGCTGSRRSGGDNHLERGARRMPDASVAVQVTVLVPCAKTVPLAGVQL